MPSQAVPVCEEGEGDGHLLLSGVIRHHLFMGSYYRYMVEVAEQPIFVDDDELLPPGPCTVSIPHSKAHWF